MYAISQEFVGSYAHFRHFHRSQLLHQISDTTLLRLPVIIPLSPVELFCGRLLLLDTAGWLPNEFSAPNCSHPKFSCRHNVLHKIISNVYPPRTDCRLQEISLLNGIVDHFTRPHGFNKHILEARVFQQLFRCLQINSGVGLGNAHLLRIYNKIEIRPKRFHVARIAVPIGDGHNHHAVTIARFDRPQNLQAFHNLLGEVIWYGLVPCLGPDLECLLCSCLCIFGRVRVVAHKDVPKSIDAKLRQQDWLGGTTGYVHSLSLSARGLVEIGTCIAVVASIILLLITKLRQWTVPCRTFLEQLPHNHFRPHWYVRTLVS
mmetsp:Transcript_15822/g.45592  ORF Transcript_15822/g.45592 Transcript_15822/m.45592 type:complete len:317 (-) Transcript_15822:624-1574(-)